MSILTDFVEQVTRTILSEGMKKLGGKRARRRKRALTPTERLNRIEKLLKPARKQTSRKRTVRSRSKARRRAY